MHDIVATTNPFPDKHITHVGGDVLRDELKAAFTDVDVDGSSVVGDDETGQNHKDSQSARHDEFSYLKVEEGKDFFFSGGNKKSIW